MQTIDELEASLQANWDLETLAVYADLLQSVGDPRGELIALDLDPELRCSPLRRERVQAWLGGTRWHPAQFSYGFLDYGRVDDDSPEPMFAAPVHGRVRGLMVYGKSHSLARRLASFASRRWPWLSHLTMQQFIDDAPPVGDAIIEQVIEATPHVHTLELRGDQVLRAFPHPALRKLVVSGAALAHTGLHVVEELDLMLYAEPADAAELARFTAQFTGLRRLDLARCGPRGSEANVSVWSFLRALPDPGPITELRLPALRSANDVANLRELLARWPTIEVTIARAYTRHAAVAGIEHPRVRMPPLSPWPPGAELSPRDAVSIAGEEMPLYVLTYARFEASATPEGAGQRATNRRDPASRGALITCL